ncbi:hypothetical protein P5G51_000560 [Virgibacillus sp. 179-BFC.A HS]|uniref:Cxxc_20_cxxc protein n=1 Tax=Tigheibacillus jepli TaxID=3035914 RepID=A0ABU5CCP7_9BACI|nr:TIGR04104 family putative zinc finger protein [Virgibacillus sp. 179-BFC.A HS]MDY0404103.1 hypothetical protein [Virgibacillus sp. 179-BFC.A HS]
MPICSHCKHEWTYKQALKSSFRITKKCPYCGENNYEDNKQQGGLFAILSVVAFMLLNILFDIPLSWVITIAIIYLTAFIFIRPPFIKLHSEQRPYW